MYLFKYIYKLSSVQQIVFSWLVVNNIFKAELVFIGKKRKWLVYCCSSTQSYGLKRNFK